NLVLARDHLFLLDAAGEDIGQPLTPEQVRDADGESERTTMVAYDSLGAHTEVNVTMVLEEKIPDQGTVWRYYVEGTEAAAGGGGIAATTGLVRFNSSGAMITDGEAGVQIAQSETGAF